MRILLIAGHGAGYPGAIGCGYTEAELTRKVVAGVEPILSGFADVEVFDPSKKMSNYIAKGNSFDFTPYDYVLEIHFNAIKESISDGKVKGSEILVHPTEGVTTVEELILQNLKELGFTNRGVKKNRWDLIVMNTCKGAQSVSYALVEVCFIDDPDDMNIYLNNTAAVNHAIAEGVIGGYGLSPKPLLVNADEITWELNHQFFPINDFSGFISALDEAKKSNSPLYWGYYKLANKITV